MNIEKKIRYDVWCSLESSIWQWVYRSMNNSVDSMNVSANVSVESNVRASMNDSVKNAVDININDYEY